MFAEICHRTIITDTDFSTRSGVLLKQNPQNVEVSLGLGGEWKLEET